MICILKKDYLSGSIAIISVHLLSEILIHYFNVEILIYRLLFIRYIIYVWLGITFYYFKEKIKLNHVLLLGIWSFMYIYSISYLGYKVKLFTYWTGTSLPVAFYPFLLIYLFKKVDKLKINDRLKNTVIIIGKASYHIYLVQMFYYFMPISNSLIAKFGLKATLFFNELICITIGIAFYKIESIIINFLRTTDV